MPKHHAPPKNPDIENGIILPGQNPLPGPDTLAFDAPARTREPTPDAPAIVLVRLPMHLPQIGLFTQNDKMVLNDQVGQACQEGHQISVRYQQAGKQEYVSPIQGIANPT